jgi:uncharacterized protein DUF5318
MWPAHGGRPAGSGAVGTLHDVSFRADSLRSGTGSSPRAGVVDHRLARRALISEYRKGRLAKHQVCDAHPELLRAARGIGRETAVDCPICEGDRLVHVTYVFGPRMGPSGRCVSERDELAVLDRRADHFTAYVVEVCRSCEWHHLVRTLPVGGRTRTRARS